MQELPFMPFRRYPIFWVPAAASGTGGNLLMHRHKLVRMRTQVKTHVNLTNHVSAINFASRFWGTAIATMKRSRAI